MALKLENRLRIRINRFMALLEREMMKIKINHVVLDYIKYENLIKMGKK